MAGDPEGIVVVDLDGIVWKLQFGLRAQKEAEAHFNKPLVVALETVLPMMASAEGGDAATVGQDDIRQVDMTGFALLFGFALLKHHPDAGDAEVEDIIDRLGFAAALGKFMEAIKVAMVREGGAGAAKPNPPTSRRAKSTGSS